MHGVWRAWTSLKACYRSGSTAGGTPQRSWVRSPSGANFSSGVKKTPSLVPRPKHCGARPNSQGDGPPCTGGAGVRGFSWPAVRRSFYLSNNAVGAVSPPAGQVFFSSDDFSSVLRAILCFYTRRALRALLSNAACKHERTPTYQPMRK